MKQQTGEPGLELIKPEDRYRTGVVKGLDGQTIGYARTEEAEKLNERTRDVAQLNRSINRIKELMKQGKGVSEKARMDAVSMISKMQSKDYFKTGALDADTLLAMDAMLGDAGAWTDVTSIDRMEEMQKILNDSVVTGLTYSGMDPMSDELKARLMSRSAVMSQPATERDRQRFKMAEQVLRNPGQYGEQAVAAAKRTLGMR